MTRKYIESLLLTILAFLALYAALLGKVRAQDYGPGPPAAIGAPVAPVPEPAIIPQPVPVAPPVAFPVAPVAPIAPVCRPGVVDNIGTWPYPGALTVRVGPGIWYEPIGILFEGTAVQICAQYGSWGKLPGSGWVSLNFVSPLD